VARLCEIDPGYVDVIVSTAPRFWTALYQGRPTPDVGDIWLRTGWRRYETPLWTQGDDDVVEWVIELDRPTRPTRRGGAKSDPIDAVRAAREALGRTHLAQPRA